MRRAAATESGKISLVERLGGVTYAHALLANGLMITVESREAGAFEIGKTQIFGVSFQRALLFGTDGIRL